MTDTMEPTPALDGIMKGLDDKAQLAKWETAYQQAKMARMGFERQWYLNLAFYFGQQWVQWDSSYTPVALGRLVEPISSKQRVRLTINVIRKIIRRELAKLNKEQIRGYISPDSSDDVDIAAARAGEKVMDYVRSEIKLDEQLKRADFWMLLTGTAFVKDYYDPSKFIGGDYGAPVVEPVSPFHLLVPNLEEPEIENQDWVMHITVKSVDQIERQFGVKVGNEGSVASNTVDAKMLSAMGMNQANSSRKGVELKEVWIKPSKDYPNGAVFTWVKDKVVQYLDKWPYEFKDYPFTRRQYIESGRFYADATVTDLIPLQVEYNRTRSQIVEDKNRMARPMLVAQMGSVDVQKITARPGQVIEYKPGATPPSPLTMQNLPNYVMDHLNRIVQDMHEISSQQDLNSSAIPPGVTAATAIAYIQEQQDSSLIDSFRNKEFAYQKVCRHLLAYIGTFWDAGRTVKVSGDNQAFEAQIFRGSDLGGNTDWRVVTGSATPQSYSARQAQIMDLMTKGMIPVDEGLKHLDMGDTARIFEDMQIDQREAERENLKMGQGVPCPVTDWQKHVMHITVHDNFRKREEFENFPDQIKAVYRAHVFLHMLTIAQINGIQIPIPPEALQDPFFVDVQAEKALRKFVDDLQSAQQAPQGAQPPPPH